MSDPKTESKSAPAANAAALTFEALPSTHKDHQPVSDGPFLLLRSVETPNPFIKRGSEKWLRTGIKFCVPEDHVCVVGQRVKHGDCVSIVNLQYLTPGTSGEISVLCSAGPVNDLNVRVGMDIGAAWLVKLTGAKFQSKPESK